MPSFIHLNKWKISCLYYSLKKKKELRKSFIVQIWRLTLVITSAQMFTLSGPTLCSLKPCVIACLHMGKTPGTTHGYGAGLWIYAFLMGSSVGDAGRLAPGCGFPCDSLAGTNAPQVPFEYSWKHLPTPKKQTNNKKIPPQPPTFLKETLRLLYII